MWEHRHSLELRLRHGTFYLSKLADVAEYVKGIDILEEHVQRARVAGYYVEVGNAEDFVDEEPYDLIFAGELIEHLSNAGNFLSCCRENLKDGGAIIITTPNAYALSRVSKVIAGITNEPPLNPEHTCYYTPATLSHLVSRQGLAVEAIYYADYDYGDIAFPFLKRHMLRINRFSTKLAPHVSQSIVAVIKRS